MRWVIFNALGAAAWIAGVCCAKGMSLPGDVVPVGEHRLLVSAVFCLAAILLLIWSNLRNPA